MGSGRHSWSPVVSRRSGTLVQPPTTRGCSAPPYAALVHEQVDPVRQAGVTEPTGTGIARDLGCGSGFQSIALAELGYPTVIAVDSSAKLLAHAVGQLVPQAACRP
jgi:protein-L-isoaspartate O-methyltransferase